MGKILSRKQAKLRALSDQGRLGFGKLHKRRPKDNRKKLKPKHRVGSSLEFCNREIAWLEFNKRVLNEALDVRNPLLERLRFLSIASSNLDEFIMKRVGGFKRQKAIGYTGLTSDGLTAAEQLKLIRKSVAQLVKEQSRIYSQVILPELKEKGVWVCGYQDLANEEKKYLQKYYRQNVFPILTPLSVDPGHPFPFISNLSTSLGVALKHPDRPERLFARVKVPRVLPQWISLPANGKGFLYKFISLVDVIMENLHDLFPNMKVLSVMAFRLTRNAELERDEEDASDLLEMIEEEIRQRRFAEVVRLEHEPNPDPWMLKFLMEELDLEKDDVYEINDELDYTTLDALTTLVIPGLRFEAWQPVVPKFFHDESQDVFSQIAKKDILLHHPYESFSHSVERFIRAASEDDKVLAIKMTLYRTGDQSPFVKAMIRAAEEGKQVVCLIELKARFDEERNIYWAQALENAGVHVVYGVVGLKTHSKVALVVRQEDKGIKCYAHFGTGNYNVQTSKFYTDLGLLTAKPELTGELVELFHYLTGRSLKTDYQHLLVAPHNMASRFLEMIEREIVHAKAGRPARIIAKFNNMEENQISAALYRASHFGVKIDLIVRGFCTLRPQLRGLSDNIRVISVIGRFLEHSRLFYFQNAQEDPERGEFFMGSADWMYRNMHARVECIVPILDAEAKKKCWNILHVILKDHRQAWDMSASGSYKQRRSDNPELQKGSQEVFMELAKLENQKLEGPVVES